MNGSNRSHFWSALAGGLVVAVVMAALPALAGNGDYLVLGEKNTAKTVTRLNTRGGLRVDNVKIGNPALILNVLAGTPPMQVNSAAKVTNLNADLLDGQHALLFPFRVELNEGQFVTVYDGPVFDVAVRCEDFGVNPDHIVKVRVTSTAAWFIDDGSERATGFGDLISVTSSNTSSLDYVIWSNTTSDSLIVDLPWLSAETTSFDCMAVGTVTSTNG